MLTFVAFLFGIFIGACGAALVCAYNTEIPDDDL
jgi:hypothetical protein